MTHLLLEIFTDLIIHFKLLLELLEVIFIDFGIIIDRRRRAEEVEERLCGSGFAHESRAVCVCS
jgi:hypothetical protein